LLDAWIHVAGAEALPAAGEQGWIAGERGWGLVASGWRAGWGITVCVLLRRREVWECGCWGLALGTEGD